MINRQCIRQEFLHRKLTPLYWFDSFSKERHATTFICRNHAFYRPDDSVDKRTRVVWMQKYRFSKLMFSSSAEDGYGNLPLFRRSVSRTLLLLSLLFSFHRFRLCRYLTMHFFFSIYCSSTRWDSEEDIFPLYDCACFHCKRHGGRNIGGLLCVVFYICVSTEIFDVILCSLKVTGIKEGT